MPVTEGARQAPAEAAVVMATVLRPSLLRAARSVFAQDFPGRIHLLVGIDVPQGDPAVLDAIRAERPDHVMLTVLDLGYSTSQRHGGLYPNHYSGALRAILAYGANSARVAFLDDNDWWAPTHLAKLCQALDGRQWAFSHRWVADEVTGWPICPDEWDSLGPGKGVSAAQFGGFVQPSTLMLDKGACHHVLPLWAQALPDGRGEDRLVFEALNRGFRWGCSAEPTCFCTLDAATLLHPHHAEAFRQRGLRWVAERGWIAALGAHLDAAAAQLARGDAATAEAGCRAALGIHPHHAQALRMLACALVAQGRDAAAFLAQAALLDSGLPRNCETSMAAVLPSLCETR